MDNKEHQRSGIKRPKLNLKLRSRQASLDRQESARESTVEARRSVTPVRNASCERIQLDKHLVGLLKRLVNQVIDAENLCQTLDGRITRLQASKSAKKIPSGLALHVTAKGKNPQELQRQFDAITKEAEIKLIEATLEDLKRQKQEASENCDKSHQSIADAIENWRSNFSSSVTTFTVDADKYAQAAADYASNYYFQRISSLASKMVADELKKQQREAKRADKMETGFEPTEQSISDMVDRKLDQKLRSALLKTAPPSRQPHKRPGSNKKKLPGRQPRRNDSSSPGLRQPNRRNSSSSSRSKPPLRSRSKTRRKTANSQRVRFPSSSKPSKNGPRGDIGHGT